jgi:hypothetical protein
MRRTTPGKVEAQIAKGIWIIPIGMVPGALQLLKRPLGGLAFGLFVIVVCGLAAAFSLLLWAVFKRGLLSPAQGTILATAAYVVTFGMSLAAVFAALRIAG